MQISEVMDGTYKIIEDYKETVRIGDSVYATGNFTPDSVQIILNTLKRMRIRMDNMKVSHIRAVGTAPFRDAGNTAKVVETVKKETGIDIDVISGEEEARLVYLAATGQFDLSETDVLFVDIGGGSTEFSFSSDGALKSHVSTSLGCLKLTKEFVLKQKATREEIKKINEEIKKTLKNLKLPRKIDKIIFTGGTVNALSLIYARRNSLSNSSVKYVETDFIAHLTDELSAKNYEDRKKIPDLEPERADISLAAALIVKYVLQKYKLNIFFTFAGGLRNGLTIDLLNRMGKTLLFQDRDDIRHSKLIETGKKYKFDEEHALHVTDLCHKLFLSTFKHIKLKKSDWLLLEAASILHDIGQHIAYQKHHKHSGYLIKNTELVGYTENEKVMIAEIAKYHRRDAPKNLRAFCRDLSARDNERVYKLAAILRIADGLDRSHMSAVKDLNVTITEKQIELELTVKDDISDASDYISTDREGVHRKKDMYEKVTNKELIIKK
jgi:exopolyphosphatase/guanosine-5'-triphosphate,3'-diphosphate pyrophosphatase